MKGYFSGQDIGVWLRRLRAMSWKELLQLWRDPVLLFFIVYAFTVDIYNAGSGVTLQLNNAAFAVLDTDRSAASRELAGRFQPPHFNPLGLVGQESQGLSLLDNSDALFVLDIPPQFERTLARGEPATVQMQVDASNSVLATLATADATQIVASYGLETGIARLGFASTGTGQIAGVPMISNVPRVWFNPNQNDAWFMAISELLNVITVFAILLPAAAMVREKERGTIEQLIVSPLTPFQVMAPKVLAMTGVILAATALSLGAVLAGVFGVPVRGSLLLFFAATTLYVVALSGLGLYIATLTRNMAQASMLSILVLAPMIFLSGAWTPPEAMPTVARWLMVISPLYYYIDVAYGVILKGAGLDVLGPSFAGIVVLGGLVVGLGLWRFKRQFD
ncbi:ABC transporter permease [Ideonella oryzae]|uniref:Transport permease protein n=1 Tax=Ideonella oryzae TaxID=2937441 RepID=A0ABT1BJB7_9BURK|nr:ABC transporter permease [Ideonella oryzae]MCO5976307.1 ABC transporter permease [Ideonella oryzae]